MLNSNNIKYMLSGVGEYVLNDEIRESNGVGFYCTENIEMAFQ